MPRHGSGQQVQRSSAGSIPHDRTKILQICSSHPRPLHRPRQSASRHPPVVTNRPATDRVRRDPRLIQQPFHHPPACWSASTPFTHLIRGTQIPIAKPQHPRPPPAVSSLGGLRTPAPRAGRATVRHPQTFTDSDVGPPKWDSEPWLPRPTQNTDYRSALLVQKYFQCLPAIQSRICVDATVFFGVCGFKVPAIALQPSLIISWANCFASASDLNLRVARTGLRSPSSRLGVIFVR